MCASIDFALCKKYTESYRGVPSSYVAPRCSGRTELCNEVQRLTNVDQSLTSVDHRGFCWRRMSCCVSVTDKPHKLSLVTTSCLGCQQCVFWRENKLFLLFSKAPTADFCTVEFI